MTIKYHTYESGSPLLQGSAEWFAARCGLLTASEMKLIITPKKLEYAQNDKEKSHVYELAAQRISQYVEPTYIGDDMLRGQDEESFAREAYRENYGDIEEVGFITNDKFGFTIGYSPDGKIAGKSAGIEAKSRRQKFQIETIANKKMPDDFLIQVQTGLLVAEWEFIDFISYHGGLPMCTIRIWPDTMIQAAIVKTATIFEEKLRKVVKDYADALADKANRFIATERREMGDIKL